MYDQFKYSIKVVEFENLRKLKSLFLEFTSLLDFLKIGKIASNRLSSQKSQYHQANCSSLVVNQSLRYQNQANFKVVKSANYFAHLMFEHPVFIYKFSLLTFYLHELWRSCHPQHCLGGLHYEHLRLRLVYEEQHSLQGARGTLGVKIQVSPNQKTSLTKVVRHN